MGKYFVASFVFVCVFVVFNAFASEPSLTALTESEMAPLLDLQNGGQASGAAQGAGPTAGVLVNGSLLPQSGPGFARRSGDATSWGAGIMVSMIVNSALHFLEQYPDSMIYLGDIGMEHGGSFRPHKSHQNGLDVDVLFLGQRKYESVLDPAGNVTSRFDTERNWAYWRLITSQQIMARGRAVSAVSMILVDPRLKTHLCAWAKDQNLLQDPLNQEVMRRLRPTVGHDDHFHVRLRCSPHYAGCIDGGVNSSLGCE